MTKVKKSLAKKILIIVSLISLLTTIILFIGTTELNKKAFYELERQKAELIAKNYAPFISMHLFLDMKDRVNQIIKQLLSNKNVTKVILYKHGRKIISKQKSNQKVTIKISTPIYQPNSNAQIGRLIIYYSTNQFKKFMKKYSIFFILSVFFIILSITFLYLYISKLLKPLKDLSNLLQNFNPEKKIDIPYKNQDDEVGLISNAIDISNKKTLEYSNDLQELTTTLIEANKDLNKRVQEELNLLREKDKQLLHQSRLAQMGEMINMIAHQWRQPLSAITATTNNLSIKLLFDEIDKEEFENEIELIAEYAQYLSKTIDDFRNFFKENKTTQKTYINSIIEDTLKIAKISIEHHRISLQTNLDCEKEIETYPNELKQVILNLIKNAQDALLDKKAKNPYIKLETKCEKDQVIITVSDNAGGIPEDILPNIFNPYFSTKLEKDGTGLGLYMSKTIVEEHCRGKITAYNADKGAIFTIKLPINDDIEKI